MSEFEAQLKKLNPEQREAVEQTEGPVLVIAGPGTGKTQLLSTRAAYILQNTDAAAHNILCLTFTESGAYAMRQRLVNIIGQKAYNITISTYHAFGSELITRFPEYFNSAHNMNAIDDLGIYTIFDKIIERLPYDNPLKRSSYYIDDIRSTISDCKRALLTPKDLRNIARANESFKKSADPMIKECLLDLARITPRSIPQFERLQKKVGKPSSSKSPIKSLRSLFYDSLTLALEETNESGKTKPLTAWKNSWLARDDQAQFVLAGGITNQKLIALADIYESYLKELHEQRLYDYDDMILRAIKGLKENKELQYSLQEQYLYIMLDEFQDTNGAQLELVRMLTNSPLYEGKPNILAVGDDDQAIYTFQGADYSHMLQFQGMYRDVRTITLTKNYRSHQDILHSAHNIANQIESRLHNQMEGIEKFLTAENKQLPSKATQERHEFKSDIAQFAWVTKKITKLIQDGVDPKEIAIIAPKHRYLEPILPYLAQNNIPVRYEKREDILADPHVQQLIRMCELVQALGENNHKLTDSLWPEVLSYDFWKLPTEKIWELSWHAREENKPWLECLLDDRQTKQIALFFSRLSRQRAHETLETILDMLIGTLGVILDQGDKSYQSPYFSFYFERNKKQDEHAQFWSLLSNLTVLRQHLRDRRGAYGKQLYLDDFLTFISEHQNAGISILNTSPYHESSNAVQIMTAYKAKGLEFECVFMLASIDEAWGSSSRAKSTSVPLPQNLQFVRYSGANDDERLRLLFVAITRAKSHLYMTSYQSSYTNRPTARIKYFEEVEEAGSVINGVLPAHANKVLQSDAVEPSIEDLSAYWTDRHLEGTRDVRLQELLTPRLERFQLAPTHLNSFTDVVYGGPDSFLLSTLLRFPNAPNPDGEFGNAIHATIEWLHLQQKQTGALPPLKQALHFFEQDIRGRNISDDTLTLLITRGKLCLKQFISQRSESFKPEHLHEFNFRREGVFVGHAHLTGKVDKMIVNKDRKTITIVDYKTGKSFQKWSSNELKLHKYKQQLYFYKLLVEGSYTFSDYTVNEAYIEFVEPDDHDNITTLKLAFDQNELRHVRNLIVAVWDKIKKLDMPDIEPYELSLKGIKSFEETLLKNSSE